MRVPDVSACCADLNDLNFKDTRALNVEFMVWIFFSSTESQP